MKKNLLIWLFLIASMVAQAQQPVLSGRIYFERKENQLKQFEGEEGGWVEEMKKRTPKYRTDQFELVFNKNKSYYHLVAEDESNAFSWGRVATDNIVTCDFNTQRSIAYKAIFDRNYAIQDSMRVLKWKMLGEFRNIAGYDCRKAATIILDSIYVIAFYTDQIPVKGGPESFSGLPGMILGLVVPRLNITWFATKVEPITITEAELQPSKLPKKTTPVNNKGFLDEIVSALKDWGDYATKIFWKSVI